MKIRVWLASLLVMFGIPHDHARAADRVVYTVAPQDTDPAIQRFTQPSLVIFDRGTSPEADLLVFLPGTAPSPGTGSGIPFAHIRNFLDTAADAGYRVIALQYDNNTWVLQRCARNLDPSCSAKFREKRIFGDDVTDLIDDTPAESIVNRLAKLLQYLDRQHPGEGWGGYLANGKPQWRRIAVAGHSQGAGMAAFIGKRENVARVVLFSGPVDATRTGNDGLAPWITGPSATPPDRWYAMYHAQERKAAMLQRSYEMLGIPHSHVRVANLQPNSPPRSRPNADLYHLSVNGDGTTPRAGDGTPLYRSDWAYLFGRSP